MSASASRPLRQPERLGLLWWLPPGGQGNGLTDAAWGRGNAAGPHAGPAQSGSPAKIWGPPRLDDRACTLRRRESRYVGEVSIPAQSIYRSQDDQCCAGQLIDLWQEGEHASGIIGDPDDDGLITAQPGQTRCPHFPRGTESLHAADGRRPAQPRSSCAVQDLVIQRAAREYVTGPREDRQLQLVLSL